MRVTALTWAGLGASYLGLGVYLGGLVGVLIIWAGFNGLLVGASYHHGRPTLFAKDAEGHRGWTASLLLWPYLLLTWLAWLLARRRVTASEHIHGWVWLGRLPARGEIPAEVERVVDLTAELPRSRVGARAYLTLPTLDKLAPDPAGLKALLETLSEDPRPTLIHCAMGHGRSATVVAALLLREGVVSNVDEAEVYMRARRPGVGLSLEQRALLESIVFFDE